MSRQEKLLWKILQGTSDTNIAFDDLAKLLRSLGFNERIKGSHHIFTMDGVEEIINIQPHSNKKAKPYQVKQIRQVILKYRLLGDSHVT